MKKLVILALCFLPLTGIAQDIKTTQNNTKIEQLKAEAAKKAAETVDKCIEKVATAGYEHGYTVFILADHGNSDVMMNPDGSPNTQHSTNLVPLIVMDKNKTWHLKPGKLGDIAPSILTAMGLEVPPIMTGNVLLS